MCIIFAANVVIIKLQTGQFYYGTNVPELGVRGIATISVLQLWTKGQILLSGLAGMCAYRAWRHPTEAMMLQRAPRLDDLHRKFELAVHE